MLDWGIYEDCLSDSKMRAIWSEQATIANWLRVEQTLTQGQVKLGLVPPEAAKAITQISATDLDQDKLRQDMTLVGRPIVGLVRQLRALVGEDLASHIHYGATTQDIMDSAMILQAQEGCSQIQQVLNSILSSLRDLQARYGSVPIMGRTNGQYALPITLGQKLQQWHSELLRRQQLIDETAKQALALQLGGAVGDLRAYPEGIGQRLKDSVAQQLGLASSNQHWQNCRDSLADLIHALGALCASLCKIAHNVNMLASSDIDELKEGYCDGRGASSAMAHKQNQRASEFGEALARLGRQRAEQIGELTLHEHERSGGVWIGEWILIPEVFILTSGALMWVDRLFAGLEIRESSMRAKVKQAEQATS